MKKIKNILILAGGDSTRFWPLRDKITWSFLGEPLIKYQTRELAKYGQQIYLVTSKNNFPEIKRTVDTKVKLIIQEKQHSGMAGAILSAKDQIKGEVLIVNGGDVINFSSINQLFNKLNSQSEFVVTAKKIENYFPGGYLKFEGKKLTGVVEKPGADNRPSNLVRLVFDYYADFAKIVNSIKNTRNTDSERYEVAMNRLIAGGAKTSVIEYEEYFYPVKYPWHILSITNFFLKKIIKNKIDKSASISPKAIVIPPVFIGKNVRVGDFSKIVGPTYIDENTIIADHTLVYQSQVGKNCLIGGYSEVTRSYLGNQVMLHRNYVGDSVIDEKVMLGAGAATANFRFDGMSVGASELIKLGSIIGQRTKIGVNATLLPGIKVGKNCFVGPGEIVRKDIKDNLFFIKGETRNNKL